jgi:hypothetical protein
LSDGVWVAAIDCSQNCFALVISNVTEGRQRRQSRSFGGANLVRLLHRQTRPINNLVITMSAADDINLVDPHGTPMLRHRRTAHDAQGSGRELTYNFNLFFRALAAGARQLPLTMTISIAYFSILTSVRLGPGDHSKVGSRPDGLKWAGCFCTNRRNLVRSAANWAHPTVRTCARAARSGRAGQQ